MRRERQSNKRQSAAEAERQSAAEADIAAARSDAASGDDAPKRHPVDFEYTALNWTFIHRLAQIATYAGQKYGAPLQYTRSRLEGEKSPINHALEHLRLYLEGVRYDHFDGDVRWHLAAAAYNCMMEFFYAHRFGELSHPLAESTTPPK